jgi:putative membrane protein
VIGLFWLVSGVILWSGWAEATYLSLELFWALPPIGLQLAFGADILWRNRRLVFLAIVPPTLFLSAADALAINTGVWTINPEQSLNIFIGGILPVEEMLFFLLTNTLVVFGMVLLWSEASQARLASVKAFIAGLNPSKPAFTDKLLPPGAGHSEESQA